MSWLALPRAEEPKEARPLLRKLVYVAQFVPRGVFAPRETHKRFVELLHDLAVAGARLCVHSLPRGRRHNGPVCRSTSALRRASVAGNTPMRRPYNTELEAALRSSSYHEKSGFDLTDGL